MDVPTRLLLEAKVDATTSLLGYPDLILNTTALDARYLGFGVEAHELMGNQVRLHRFALADNLRRLGAVVDKGEWPMSFPPATVNAFYMYSRNQMLFPAGVLQMPLFSVHQPMSLNLGHIGTFMGHEVRKQDYKSMPTL